MSDIYGSQGDTIGESAFIWASNMRISLLGANATKSGTIKLGHFTLSSMFDRDVLNTIAINDLNMAVHTTIPIKDNATFNLHSGIVNHDLANTLSRKIDVTSSVEEMDMGGEVIAFAIIQRPFTSLETSGNVAYSINVQVSSNYAFMPKLWDAFSKSLNAPETEFEQSVEGRRDRRYVIRAAHNSYSPNVNSGKAPLTVWNAVSKLKSLYNDHKGWVDPLAGAAMSALKMLVMLDPAKHD